MSEALTIEHDGDAGQEPRRGGQRPQREARHQQADPVTIELPSAEDDSEAIVAASARQIQQHDRQVAESRRVAAAAQARANAAEQALQQTNVARMNDQEALLAGVLESSTNEMAAARLAIRSAREVGDTDAEADAIQALSQATYRQSQVTGELGQLRAMKQQVPRPRQQQTQNGPTPEAQAWIDSHPAYLTDMVYRGAANEAHNTAIAAGLPEGSQAYVDHIDNLMEQHFGEGHGQSGRPVQPQRRDADVRNTSLPPSRGQGAGAGGYKRIQTILTKEPLLVQERAGNAMSVKFFSDEQRRDFQEGADACRMPLQEYVLDQINIAKERDAGGTGDLITTEGARYGSDRR